MGKKLVTHRVRGKEKTWDLEFFASSEQLRDMCADGLEVGQICNMIPTWAKSRSVWSIRIWSWLQDIWNFRIPGRW